MPKDPVCGMTVDPKSAAGCSEYSGETYYFCSRGCKRLFDQSPETYLGRAPLQGNTDQSKHPTKKD